MHRKAINPLQELIRCSSAYLAWHGEAFTYPLGRSKVFSCFKTWQHPKISTDFIFSEQLPAMVINAGLLSLTVCGIASLAGFVNYSDSSQRHTALLNQFKHTVLYTHARIHVAAAVAANRLCAPWGRGRAKTRMCNILKGTFSSRGCSPGSNKLAGRTGAIGRFCVSHQQMQAANSSKPPWLKVPNI